MVHALFYQLAAKNPLLKEKLLQAEMNKEPAEFMQQCALTAAMMTVGMTIAVVFLLLTFEKPWVIAFPVMIVMYIIIFFTFVGGLDGKISKLRKGIDREILFVGKFMIAELGAGVPLFQVLKNIEKNYEGIQKYVRRIINDIELGTGVDEAINRAILENPSKYFQKVFYQISNAVKTGSDISTSLDVVLDQINRKQMIEVEAYSRKLNPIALFYLMVAVIFPSLGMVMLIIIASFVGLSVGLGVLLGITGALFLVQIFFATVIESSRPAVEM